MDGTLRKLGEKDLLLQTGGKQILRFRVLAKTQFRNKQGEPIRDSLLHPGDQLTVQANPDDEETALRVILLRNGTEAERAAAEKPYEEASVRAPRAEDFGKSRTVTDTNTANESQPQFETPGGPSATESGKHQPRRHSGRTGKWRPGLRSANDPRRPRGGKPF